MVGSGPLVHMLVGCSTAVFAALPEVSAVFDWTTVPRSKQQVRCVTAHLVAVTAREAQTVVPRSR